MARDFDGVDDEIALPVSDVWEFINNNMLCAIIRADSLSAAITIASWGVSGSRGIGLYISATNGNLHYLKNGVSDLSGTATTAIAINTWYALLFHSSSGGDVTFRRLNLETGVIASQTVASAGAINVTVDDPGQIGRFINDTSPFDGRIAQVALYNRAAFSETEFEIWARGGWTSFLPVVGFWPLFGTASPEPDWSGNNNHGTVTGAVRIDHPPGISAYWLAPQVRRVQRVFAAGATFFQTLPATAVGVAVLSTVPIFVRALAATAVGVAALTKGMFVTLAATAVGSPAMTKGMFKTLTATAVGVPTLATALLTSVTMAATAVGTATLSTALVFGQTLAAVATGVAGMVTEFIGGSGGGRKNWLSCALTALWKRGG